MFLNFFLLQKGYPEVIIKISDRDNYYNSLIDGDKGNLNSLIDLLADNIRDSINVYEELINEDERQKAWLEQYKEQSAELYEKARSKHSFQYEVWKNQLTVFKTLLEESINGISEYLPHLEFSIKEYEILTFNQYLDFLEDRKVSSTWFINLRIIDKRNQKGSTFIFYFQRLYRSKPLRLLGVRATNRGGRPAYRRLPPVIKLYISARDNASSVPVKSDIDLVNVGTYKDQLSFGIIDRTVKRDKDQKPKINTVTENPGKVIRHFIDQVLEHYFEITPKKSRRTTSKP
jgi:hypothetical protein